MVKEFLCAAHREIARTRHRDPFRRQRRQLTVETLEARCLLDSGFRTITEVGNNIANPTWGTAGTDLLRVSPVAYADGISTPSTPNTLSPREVSNNLSNQSNPIFSGADNLGPPNSQFLSDYAYAWGQFIDHDMDLTLDNSGQAFNIPADPTRRNDAMGVEPFTRSQFDPNTGITTPRQQVNAVTSYLDLSQVYGSTQAVADALRVVEGTNPDGSPILGATLKTSPGGLLPYNNLTYFTQDQLNALNMANDAHQVLDSQLFAAGDRRANENVELMSLTTLFVNNHNRLVGELATMNPADFGFTSWTNENLYQEARKLNIAEEEMITYNGYLPSILGPNALPAYAGYNPNVNAGIATEFSTVGFRFGHSLLSNTVGRDSNNGTGIADPTGNSAVNLTADFFDPNLLSATPGTDPLTGHATSDIGAVVKALADGTPNEVDTLLIDEVRNVLFGIPNVPGTDLAARDIQRARDHGIGTYNQVRVAYGLPAVTKFSQITSNVTVQQELLATYGTVDKIDPFIGMLAEDHVPGADVGPLAEAILVKQFAALRDGDRFFYLNESFTSAELNLLGQGSTLAQVLKNNTPITRLQTDVFRFTATISGTVFNDLDGNGVQEAGELPLSGRIVTLEDTSGNAIATTRTDSNGHYVFNESSGIPGTGQFQVLARNLPNGWKVTSPNPVLVALTKGDDVVTVNIGEVKHIRSGSSGSADPLTGGSSTGGTSASAPGSSSGAILAGALTSSSGVTTSSTTTQPTGSATKSPTQTDPAVSASAVANSQLAALGQGAGGVVSALNAGGGAQTSVYGEDFWLALTAEFSDPLAWR